MPILNQNKKDNRRKYKENKVQKKSSENQDHFLGEIIPFLLKKFYDYRFSKELDVCSQIS